MTAEFLRVPLSSPEFLFGKARNSGELRETQGNLTNRTDIRRR